MNPNKKHGRTAEHAREHDEQGKRDEQDAREKRHLHRGESATPSAQDSPGELPGRGESTESWIPRPPSDS